MKDITGEEYSYAIFYRFGVALNSRNSVWADIFLRAASGSIRNSENVGFFFIFSPTFGPSPAEGFLPGALLCKTTRQESNSDFIWVFYFDIQWDLYSLRFTDLLSIRRCCFREPVNPCFRKFLCFQAAISASFNTDWALTDKIYIISSYLLGFRGNIIGPQNHWPFEYSSAIAQSKGLR